MGMNLQTEYIVSVDWTSMNNIIDTHQLGYREHALKELHLWCENNFGLRSEGRWKQYSYTNFQTLDWDDVFSFINESDRTLFLLKWL